MFVSCNSYVTDLQVGEDPCSQFESSGALAKHITRGEQHLLRATENSEIDQGLAPLVSVAPGPEERSGGCSAVTRRASFLSPPTSSHSRYVLLKNVRHFT